MNFPGLRAGHEAIEQSARSSQGGNFRPFAPFLRWSEEDEEKLVLFLNEIGKAPILTLHEFVPVGTGERADGSEYQKYETFVSRRDPIIGEDTDELEDRFKWPPNEKVLAVAVELEAEYKTVNGRKRPKGFKVKTEQFERRIRDEDGDLTDDTETVTAPVVGIVTQKSSNFFQYLSDYDQNEGEVSATPFKITRKGEGTDTSYNFIPYHGHDVDLSGLVENVNGISYLGDDREDFIAKVEAAEVAAEVEAQRIGDKILETRVVELIDKERYNALVSPLDPDEVKPRWGNEDKKGKGKGKGKGRSKNRTSQRDRKNKSEKPENKQEDPEAMAKFSELEAAANK